jgi:hypothetical protein
VILPGGSERKQEKQVSTGADGEVVPLCFDDTQATGTMSSLVATATSQKMQISCSYCK